MCLLGLVVFRTVNLLHLCNADSDTVGSELVSACRSHGVVIRFEIWLGQAIGHSQCSSARMELGCESRNYLRHSSCFKSPAKDVAQPHTRSCPLLVFHLPLRLLCLDLEDAKWIEELQFNTVIFTARAVAHPVEDFTPLSPICIPHRKERVENHLSILPSSSAMSHRWNCCSAGEPTWTLPCLMAAHPCIWRWGDGTPPLPTSSASLALTRCCETWRMKRHWIWLMAVMT